VRVSTIHGSKGGEADHVVVLREMAQRTHREMREVSEEDEARVWYVAVTRARERLSIVEPRARDRYGNSLADRACPWV
jgi:superfamily I DNA/RNA helicase